MDAVEKEVQKILHKFSDIDKETNTSIQEIILNLNKIKEELNDAPPDSEVSVAQSLLLTSCLHKIKECVQTLSTEHKDLHSSVSKVGKAIDRNFVSEFSAIVPDHGLDSEESVTQINHVICEHFLRQGMLGIAETLVQESKLELEDGQKEPFLELHRILEALKVRDLQPALRWVCDNQEALRSQHSCLEFKLHRLQFIQLIQEGAASQSCALQYAKNFQPFAQSHAKEVQILMGSLLYLRQGVHQSPYSHLLDQIHWLEICDVFTRDACALLGLSVESPLSVVIKAGCAALPPLLNIKQVMQQRHCHGVWNAKDELPVEIDLGRDCRFHSIFACPILRQQSSDSNPPVRLVCGHVISRDALNKLANGNKVKCPYCPVEQSPNDARHILF